MSLFDKDIKNTSTITAKTLVDAHYSLKDEIGHYVDPLMYSYGYTNTNLNDFSEETLNGVVNDVLSYVYYYVKLGINNTQSNKFEITIPAEIFGITHFNWDLDSTKQWITRIKKKFEDRGFNMYIIYNGLDMIISWRDEVNKI